MSDKSSKLPINVELSARAEATLEVRANVPEKSAGRLVDAVTDMFRPFSEMRGLRGDQIRLQREEVAIEIAKLARRRLEIENEEIRPIPNKILIPLIGASSNEHLNDEVLKGLWANLLASAATKANVEPRFVGILKELHGRQALEFERLALNMSEGMPRPMAHLEDSPTVLEPAYVLQALANLFSDKKRPEPPEVFASIVDWIDRPGCIIVDIIMYRTEEMWSFQDSDVVKKSELDLEILCSLGLCKKINQFYRSKYGEDIQAIYYAVTELGVRFYFACKNVGPEPDIRLDVGSDAES